MVFLGQNSLWRTVAAVWMVFATAETVAGEAPAQRFSVGTFNVENYLGDAVRGRPQKPPLGRQKVRECLLTIHADVVALQEMGDQKVLLELRDQLSASGLDYPHWEHVTGFDTNIHLAVLSRFPIVRRRPHTNETYLLNGRRLSVSRGFAEVEIEVNPAYRFTLLAAHLKSKRPVAVADESEMREQEAAALRRIVDALLERQRGLNLIVLGDLNDSQNSRSVKALIGRGRRALVDTRPAEQNGDQLPTPLGQRYPPRRVTWTHHYGKEDTFSRLDYILLSQAMERERLPSKTYILTLPDWGQASDHRPIVAGFEAINR